MMHSITFGEKNSYDEWKIVPTSRPVINPPAKKKKTLEIPGANGSLDISDSLTGFPVFENRTGSIEFVVLNDFNLDNYQYQWDAIYHDILGYLHGEKMEVRLEDEPGYFYQGGLTVNSWKSDKNNSTITIDYDLQPYRYANQSSIDNWLWDPFNFTKDYIAPMKFGNIQVNGTVVREYESTLFGNAPLMPEIHVTTDSSLTVTVQTPADDLADGKKIYTKTFTSTGVYKIYELTLYKASVKYTFTGNGVVSIKFYRGYL